MCSAPKSIWLLVPSSEQPGNGGADVLKFDVGWRRRSAVQCSGISLSYSIARRSNGQIVIVYSFLCGWAVEEAVVHGLELGRQGGETGEVLYIKHLVKQASMDGRMHVRRRHID